MADIVANDVEIGLGSGATWGTATAVTGTNLLRASALQITASKNLVDQEDIGAGAFRTAPVRTQETVDVSITCDISYGNNGWKRLAAHFMGTSTATGSLTENNVGQGDYPHDIDFTSQNTSRYITLASLIEDDKLVEIPSVRLTGMNLQISAANKGSVTFTGIGDQVVKDADATNNVAGLTALSYPTDYQIAVLTGTNAYFRLAAYDTATALTSGEDLEILSYSLNLTRTANRSYVLRGANTPYTKPPRQTGFVDGTLTVGLYAVDDAIADIIALFKDGTPQMGELFLDGDQIGAGDNTSLKIQTPYLVNGELSNPGFDSKDDTRQPEISFQLFDPTTDAAGMTGVTFTRLTAIDNRATTYLE